MNRLLSAACSLCLVALMAATAQAGLVTDVEVLEYGLYTYDEKVVMMEQSNGSAKLSNIRHLRETLDIPTGDQTFFSIKYILEAAGNAQKEVTIELRVTTPSGETSKGAIKARTDVPTTTNIEFTEKDAPGAYLFQVLEGNEVLFSRTINVYHP